MLYLDIWMPYTKLEDCCEMGIVSEEKIPGHFEHEATQWHSHG
jgi:hypothetical protein